MVTSDRELQTSGVGITTNTSYYGLRTDSKPTDNVGNGSCFIEMDTGKCFFFNAEAGEWVEVQSSGGGGGSDTFWVNFTISEGTATSDKTTAEIAAAASSGKNVKGKADVNGATIVLPLKLYVVVSNNLAVAVFEVEYVFDGELITYLIGYQDSEWTFFSGNYTLTPAT